MAEKKEKPLWKDMLMIKSILKKKKKEKEDLIKSLGN